MKIVSFFSGCGGLDLGFRMAGFDVIWANEIDPEIHPTYLLNHPGTYLCKKDMRLLVPSDIPVCDGFIGGPPCQSWSVGGRGLGLNDDRGKLFLNYIKFIEEINPKFFVIENVEGIVTEKHYNTFQSFITRLSDCGYNVFYDILNAADYRIPQDRKRVFIVGFLKSLNCCYFTFPQIDAKSVSLRDAISDITLPPNYYNDELVNTSIPGNFYNHDCYAGPFDAKFMSRNRVRSWNEVSFTIQAQAKNTPLHPQAPKMTFESYNRRSFLKGYEQLYRRLSVRECARIQSFPDHFKFLYNNVKTGYKMVGNAVPPRLAYRIALSIKQCLDNNSVLRHKLALVGYYKDNNHFDKIIANKLYYVRIGLRKGSFLRPIGLDNPKFLILHNRSDIHYFILKDEEPFYIEADKLKALGFNPSGDRYLAFSIEKKLTESYPQNIFIKKSRDKTAPYLLEITD